MRVNGMCMAVLSAAATVNAHAGFSNFYVDGADQGDAISVRMNPNPSKWNSPVEDLTSTDMACGFGGTKGVKRVAGINDGSTLTLEWREVANGPGKGVIDPSHMGPCAVYMKKVVSAIDDTASGDGWFKIWDKGYDESTKKWCTTKLIDAKGLLSVQVPKGLVGGNYIVRGELLALHSAASGDPQYYIGCAQVFLKSAGNLVPESTVSIPGYVSKTDASNSYNIWKQPLTLPYPIPGPKVAALKAGGSTYQTAQAEGFQSAGCLLEVGSNWCGVEVPDYTTEKGCWDSGENCWQQNSKCWDNAPPTGGDGCKLWEAKCKGINEQCTAKNFQGPPNKGKVLTPSKKTISAPPPLGPTVIGSSTVAQQTPKPATANKAAAVSAAYSYAVPTTMVTSIRAAVSSVAAPVAQVASYAAAVPTAAAYAPSVPSPVAPAIKAPAAPAIPSPAAPAPYAAAIPAPAGNAGNSNKAAPSLEVNEAAAEDGDCEDEDEDDGAVDDCDDEDVKSNVKVDDDCDD